MYTERPRANVIIGKMHTACSDIYGEDIIRGKSHKNYVSHYLPELAST